MGYTLESQIDPTIADRERELLGQGFGYLQVAAQTGHRVGSIAERNRLVYKIDVQVAFAERIAREGIPSRLNVPDDFGYWFSGFFDGEGTIGLFTRTNPSGYSEYRMHVRLQIRDDDTETITLIYDNLKVGRVYRHKANARTNPSISFRVEKIEDLAEVIVPLFDRYPLHTKKAQQFAFWRPIVLLRYIRTLGGYANRWPTPEEDKRAFNEALHLIREIGAYTVT